MLIPPSRYFNRLFFIVFVVSLAMLFVNYNWYGYPGLFYFEPNLFGIALFLYLFSCGLKYQFAWVSETNYWKFVCGLNVYALVVLLLFFSTTAIQYTPFAPIDSLIVSFEQALHLNLQSVIEWTSQNGPVKVVLYVVYHSLGLQLVILPVVVLLFKQFEVVNEYYILLLLTWLLGSCFYYFFPTTGPASLISSPYFYPDQYFTGLKYWQIHHYIQPKVSDGGMVAMPSFHVIWAWLCVYIIRPWPIACGLLAVINSLVVVSCVFLGWHYFLDVVVSAVLLLLAHTIYARWFSETKAAVKLALVTKTG
jgi:hypothetical protein